MSKSVPVAVAASVFLTSGAFAQVEVFSTDFNSGLPSEVSGGALEGVLGLDGAGHAPDLFSGDLLRNTASGDPAAATTLTLAGLPSHTHVSVGFLLAMIDSWDSTNGTPAPDYFNVAIDGVPVLQITSANASGSNTYAGDQIYFANAGWGSWNERAFDMNSEAALQDVPHTGSSLTIDFFASGAGWQGGADESWGIDNLHVSVNVPTPGVGAAGMIALAGAAARRRR